MEAYCDAKALLLRQCDVGIYNADDPWAERLMADATCRRRFSYAVNGRGGPDGEERGAGARQRGL